MNIIKHRLSILFIALLFSLCGCQSNSNELINSVHNAEADTISTAQSVTDSEPEMQPTQLSNAQIGNEIANRFADEWTRISSDNPMVLPQVSVFSIGAVNDLDNVIAVVYPEYKTNRTVLYGVKNTEVIHIGSISSGWQFEITDNGTDKLLHIVYVLSGAGGMNEIDDNYYKISSDGVTLVNSYGRMESNGSATAWFKYENGSSQELTIDEYNSVKSEITEVYSITQRIDLDKDINFSIDNYFDFSDDIDGFSEYITDMIDINEE